MKTKQHCQKEDWVSTLDGEISVCRCGLYHVRINAITLHLTAMQFDGAARLFKLAFGMLAGQASKTRQLKEVP